MGNESSIENPVIYRAKKAGYFVRKLKWIGRDGAPDDFFARKDRGVVLIEFKRPGGKPRQRQLSEIRELREAGVEVHICDNVEDALRILWII